jgi:hypothetical protein
MGVLTALESLPSLLLAPFLGDVRQPNPARPNAVLVQHRAGPPDGTVPLAAAFDLLTMTHLYLVLRRGHARPRVQPGPHCLYRYWSPIDGN